MLHSCRCHLAAGKLIVPRYAKIIVSHYLISHVGLPAQVHHDQTGEPPKTLGTESLCSDASIKYHAENKGILE